MRETKSNMQSSKVYFSKQAQSESPVMYVNSAEIMLIGKNWSTKV